MIKQIATCDTCVRVPVELHADGKLPTGWVRVAVSAERSAGPTSVARGATDVVWSICDGCVSDIKVASPRLGIASSDDAVVSTILRLLTSCVIGSFVVTG